MADAAIFYNNSISEVSGYSMYAEARFGSNGDAWGVPELVVGTSEEELSSVRKVWDSNLDDGFDSGDVTQTIETDITSISASDTFQNDPITFSTSISGNIQKVQVRAFALAAASVQWSRISINFYRDGTIVDSYVSGDSFGVDERNTAGLVESEAILEVTPEGTDYDQVVIGGEFRMSFDSTVIYPGATDLAGQFFVFTA